MADCFNETSLHLVNETISSHIRTLNQVINVIALPVVCVFGIVGNLLNLTILTRRKLQKSFRSLEQAANLCLIALALSDLMFCVLALLTIFLPVDNIYDSQGILFFYGLYSTFFINVFIMESTMLTVAMSLERYMAICFPLRQDLYLTTRKIKYIIVSTFVFSLLFNIPVLWRFETVPLCFNTTAPGRAVENSDHHVTGHSGKQVNLSQASSRHTYSNHEDIKDRDLSSLDTLSKLLTSPMPLSPSSSLSSLSFSSTASSLAASATLPKPSLHPSITDTTTGFIRNASIKNQPYLRGSSTSTVSSSLSPSPMWQSAIKYKIQEANVDETEKMAYRLAWALIGNVIPLILLFFFNVCLCRKIYLSYKMRRQFKRQSRAKNSSHILTLTLVVIVVMFFILVAPSELLLLVSDTSPNVEPILNFMQSLNFSVNFILYCIISPYFRKTLKYICMCGCYNIYQTSRDWKKEFETSLM